MSLVFQMNDTTNLPEIPKYVSDSDIRCDHLPVPEKHKIPLCPKCVSDTGDVLIFIISIGMTYALPITQFIIGIIHINDCPMDRFIPIYLIVAGSSGCLAFTAILLRVCVRYKILILEDFSISVL